MENRIKIDDLGGKPTIFGNSLRLVRLVMRKMSEVVWGWSTGPTILLAGLFWIQLGYFTGDKKWGVDTMFKIASKWGGSDSKTTPQQFWEVVKKVVLQLLCKGSFM